MWSLAWPWVLLALPLPWLLRRLLPEARGLAEAGLRVPSLSGFETLKDRSPVEQLLNWRFWIAVLAWCLLVVAAARPERIGDELEVPVAGRNLMLAVDLSGSMDQKDFELAGRRVDRLTATNGDSGAGVSAPRASNPGSSSARTAASANHRASTPGDTEGRRTDAARAGARPRRNTPRCVGETGNRWSAGPSLMSGRSFTFSPPVGYREPVKG